MDFYMLEYLLKFQELSTLSAAAEALRVSEPSLSRSMKKLEGEFGAPLFDRTRNRLTLNENGVLAAECARQVLRSRDDMLEKVRSFDRSRTTLSVGVCTPSVLLFLTPALSAAFPHMAVTTRTLDTETLLEGVRDGAFHLAVVPVPAEEEALRCIPCGEERLFFAVPPEHELADRTSVSFADLDGLNMLLYHDIGFWHELVASKMPRSRFLKQMDRYSFTELLDASVLPSFSSDFGKILMGIQKSARVEIPISDPEARVTYYCVCRKEQEKRLRPLLAQLRKNHSGGGTSRDDSGSAPVRQS